MARPLLVREGIIKRTRPRGVVTWTLRRERLQRREVRAAYALLTERNIARGIAPPPLPTNLYSPRSRKWHDAQTSRDLAVYQAEQVRARMEERFATGETERQQAIRLEQVAKARAYEREAAERNREVAPTRVLPFVPGSGIPRSLGI